MNTLFESQMDMFSSQPYAQYIEIKDWEHEKSIERGAEASTVELYNIVADNGDNTLIVPIFKNRGIDADTLSVWMRITETSSKDIDRVTINNASYFEGELVFDSTFRILPMHNMEATYKGIREKMVWSQVNLPNDLVDDIMDRIRKVNEDQSIRGV